MRARSQRSTRGRCAFSGTQRIGTCTTWAAACAALTRPSCSPRRVAVPTTPRAILKYLTEIALGVPCASVGASVASVYGAQLKVRNGLAVTISQSGKSPDIVALQEAARKSGALTIAIGQRGGFTCRARVPISACRFMPGQNKAWRRRRPSSCRSLPRPQSWRQWRVMQRLSRALAELPEQLSRACRAGMDAASRTWPRWPIHSTCWGADHPFRLPLKRR